MPRSNLSAESKKGLPTPSPSLESQSTTIKSPQDQQSHRNPTEHGTRGSSTSQGDVSPTLMSEPSTAREGPPLFQGPRALAVARTMQEPTGSSRSSVARGGEQPPSPGKAGGEAEAGNTQEPRLHKDSASQLSQYREQLAKDMQRNVLGAKSGQAASQPPKRVSPIQEESTTNSPSQFSPRPSTASTNTSTESGQTIRGGTTPGFMPKTPSYPFPRIGTPGYVPSSLHKPFTTLSPTRSAPGSPASSAAATAAFENTRAQDKLLSNPSTPASTMAFQPAGASQASQQGDSLDFPTPNLYELSLRLSSEPGLEAWWRTVVQLMTECYQAERLTLAVPADVTDLENVPWGQKATFNARQEDGLSMDYLATGSNFMPSHPDNVSGPSSAAADDTLKSQVPLRPRAPSRHSYTAFEDQKEMTMSSTRPSNLPNRPSLVPRSQSFYPRSPRHERSQDDALHMGLNQQALAEHDAEEQEVLEGREAPVQEGENQGRVFELLQALDYEADPLIDHHGVSKVMERGRVIALTRSYPYSEDMAQAKYPDAKGAGRSHSPEGPKKREKRSRHDPSTKLSNLLSSAHSMSLRPQDRRSGQQNIDQMISEGEPRRPPTPSYEEFEQAPPSPWSQSPVS